MHRMAEQRHGVEANDDGEKLERWHKQAAGAQRNEDQGAIDQQNR